ncbi:ABC transporter substrate-binding protein [Rhizobium ruizarguesonis]|uniref:ABC transporter substrate-binding protein n=1 Tax=Rhizobium ruizarguesonis TaxID=2081791 RepID=UPI0003F79E8F|nr:ABC transporter substrate-binding protein [Rhizobium ruizarguesonis]MBY5854985.1 ABC transporter substrate-binding protein [Rhizobium leguminosarum]QND37554.1 ABC transporter substrate-binding protein [Rhizobium leguminosarum bv. viciae]MBY5876935.1 ABC transporter substrate-binding protein [Rhizobium leguminosarum]MBY5897575.1 ABC transporter substrate-binding protein [Rhizobium leguminosarum]NEH40103.1 peptide ABC transporter substrate-binding protein [Rhizobium ruizarguesonis]
MSDEQSLQTSAISRRTVLRGALVGGVGLALGSSSLSARAQSTVPKRGGNLRVAMLGASSTETLDPHSGVLQADFARALGLYEPLMEMQPDATIKNGLAESMEPNADATEWTIRLRKGVKFHDGRTLSAKDVAYSFRRIVNPKAPLSGAITLAPLDADNIQVVDDLTLKIPMKAPFAVFPESICSAVYYAIVPEGFDPANPIGTGPFKFKTFTAGQQSVFVRFDDYWGDGGAHIDTLTITSFASDVAAFNALQSGQIDALGAAPLSLVRQVGNGGAIKALVSQPGQWTPFTMRVDQPPFNDPNVRKAFRLLVDREQMIKIALSGYGEVGNDVFSRWDPLYDTSLQRHRDLDQAKFLLKKAGQENMKIELVTSDFANGVPQMAQVFARQARDANVDVSVRQVTTDVFYGEQYLKWSFAQDFWLHFPYLPQIAECHMPGATFNETHWGNEQYTKLYNEAVGTLDAGKRKEIVHDLMKIDFEEGGYIIPSFNKVVDLLASNVEGLTEARTGYALGHFAWKSVWLS